MRCYLRGELRRRFHLAWFMVPFQVQDRLRALIRSVRAVDEVAGTVLRLDSGLRVVLEEDAEAAFLCDETASPPRGWLLVRERFAGVSETVTIAVFLHEIAHASYRLEDDTRALILPIARAEAAAWLQAAAWAAHGCLDYEWGLDVACYAMDRADRELNHWPSMTSVFRTLLGEQGDDPAKRGSECAQGPNPPP